MNIGDTSPIFNFDEVSSLNFNTPEFCLKKRLFITTKKSSFLSESHSTIDTNSVSSPFTTPLETDTEEQIESLSEVSAEIENINPLAKVPKHTKKIIRAHNKKQTLTDRFIPSRKASRLSVALTGSHEYEAQLKEIDRSETQEENPYFSLNCLYKNLVLGYDTGKCAFPEDYEFMNNNIFRYKDENRPNEPLKQFTQKPFDDCEKILAKYQTNTRKVAKSPFKVLDAPALQDDFYLNLLDWSSQNVLGVGLSSSVYLWSGQTSKVTKLCDLNGADSISSVNWSPNGEHLSIGTNTGDVQIWDSVKLKKVLTLTGHAARVGALAWNSSILASASRDQNILCRDIRTPLYYTAKFTAHNQEVCGLKWSFDNQQLASGGNDNKVYVWSLRSNNPVTRFSEHKAAVKALAWSPHQHGLLATGGGTADKTIRFWNTLQSTQIDYIDTGSQVCNLMFSKNSRELVSTHGYSQNQIVLWKYPTMEKVATLTGHTYRVLYLAMSPDGQNIVTGAGDETLRFWNAFPLEKETKKVAQQTSKLMPSKFDFR